MRDLKQKLKELDRESKDLDDIIQALRRRTATESWRLLSELQHGASVEDLVSSISHANRTRWQGLDDAIPQFPQDNIAPELR